MGSQKSVSMSCGHYLCLHLKTHYLNLSGSQKSQKVTWDWPQEMYIFQLFLTILIFFIEQFWPEFGRMRIILLRSKIKKKLICKHLRFSVKFVLFTIKTNFRLSCLPRKLKTKINLDFSNWSLPVTRGCKQVNIFFCFLSLLIFWVFFGE